jgi:hypothetical protein
VIFCETCITLWWNLRLWMQQIWRWLSSFWDTAPCSLANTVWSSRGSYCSINTLKTEAVSSSEMVVSISQTTQCNIPEDSHLQALHTLQFILWFYSNICSANHTWNTDLSPAQWGIFVAFLSPAKQMPEQYIKLFHDHFLLILFWLTICNCSILYKPTSWKCC